jgi:hypothetical protein
VRFEQIETGVRGEYGYKSIVRKIIEWRLYGEPQTVIFAEVASEEKMPNAE